MLQLHLHILFPKLGNLISLGHRELIYTFLGKGYVDAVAAHEESIVQYMKDYDASFRILEEPLMITGIGVAFAKDDDRGICEQMSQTLEEMRQDGTSAHRFLCHPLLQKQHLFQ